MRKTFLAVSLALLTGTVAAQGVGHGVGGTPPPFQGGDGGSSAATATAVSGATSVSGASSTAVQGTIVGVGVGGQSTEVGGQSTSVTFNEAAAPDRVRIHNVPNAYAPSAYPTAPCRIAVSGGGSGVGFGISVGGSILDEDCNKRELSRSFQNLGLNEDAVAVLCSSEGAANAPTCKSLVASPEPAGAAISTGPRPTSGFQYDPRSGERVCAYDAILANRTGLGVCR